MDITIIAHILLDHFLDSNGEFVYIRTIITLLTLLGFVLFQGFHQLLRWANQQNNLFFIDDHRRRQDEELGLPEIDPLLQTTPPAPHPLPTLAYLGHTLNDTATATTYL